MARDKIVWVTDDTEYPPFLDFAMHWREFKEAPDATLEQLADFCDQNAESVNDHDFVGVHRWLAVVLFRLCGREKATETIRMIAEYGGLNGVKGDEEAFAEMRIQRPWHDWEIVEGD